MSDELPRTVRPSRARELFDTVRHLEAAQIAHLARRRVTERLGIARLPRMPNSLPPLRKQPFHRAPFLLYPPARSFEPATRRLALLNLEQPHAIPIAWERPDMPALWELELQYFHWLRPDLDPELGLAFILDWIRHEPDRPGTAAWNPFGVAMRVLQWTRLLSAWQPRLGGLPDLTLVHGSLYRQGRYLARHQEFEYRGNHLMKTAAGLYAAGRYFSGSEADAWERKAVEIILRETRSQILSDGGHYERSPMYHLLVLQDLLDVLNMTTQDTDWRQDLARPAGRMVSFAAACCDPSGEIPLFNDAALDQAPARTEILDYAVSVLGRAPVATPEGSLSFPEFGLHRLVAGNWVLWVDAGRPGPDFLLAHAHADVGTIQAWMAGQPLLVDAGVFCYGGNPTRRDYDRNAYGHNVMILDGQGSCHCWGVFRVSHRPRRVMADLDPELPELRLSHDGFALLPGAPMHERVVSVSCDSLQVTDRLRWKRSRHALVELLWHLDSTVVVRSTPNGLTLDLRGQKINVEASGDGITHVERWPIARRFYQSESGSVIRYVIHRAGDLEITTRFSLLPRSDATPERVNA